MITVYYAVCSETAGKPVVRTVHSDRARAEQALASLRAQGDSERCWLAEVGKEAESWLRFFAENENDAGPESERASDEKQRA
ncbi:MAG: hypothetical protein AAFP04_12095 [Myxococcota bacterium]